MSFDITKFNQHIKDMDIYELENIFQKIQTFIDSKFLKVPDSGTNVEYCVLNNNADREFLEKLEKKFEITKFN